MSMSQSQVSMSQGRKRVISRYSTLLRGGQEVTLTRFAR